MGQAASARSPCTDGPGSLSLSRPVRRLACREAPPSLALGISRRPARWSWSKPGFRRCLPRDCRPRCAGGPAGMGRSVRWKRWAAPWPTLVSSSAVLASRPASAPRTAAGGNGIVVPAAAGKESVGLPSTGCMQVTNAPAPRAGRCWHPDTDSALMHDLIVQSLLPY